MVVVAFLLACPAPTDSSSGDSDDSADTGEVLPPLERWTGDESLGDAPRVLEGEPTDQAGGLVRYRDALWMPLPQRNEGAGAICLVDGDGPGETCWKSREPRSFAGTETVVVADRLATSAFWDSANGNWSGAVFVVDDAGGKLADASVIYEGSAGSYAGSALAVGDVRGTGTGQLLVGAFAADLDEGDEGAVWVVEPDGGGQLYAEPHRLSGSDEGDWFGGSVAVGDVDGDGQDDVLVGAMADDGLGAAHLVLGPIDGNHEAADADVTLSGDAQWEYAGKEVALGDVSGDGLADLVVSATDADQVYVVLGPGTSAPLSESDAILQGTEYSRLGFSLDASDLDRDQHADVLVGATRTEDGGAAFVFYGPVSGEHDVADADWILRAEQVDDKAGIDVTVLDWDLAVSASRAGDGAGRVYLYER
ncbi:MAG: hypothetical protein GY913_18785 [Proteobacteria bacterium]|nr:hypothetical protein [Pseudomonadota bacterium]